MSLTKSNKILHKQLKYNDSLDVLSKNFKAFKLLANMTKNSSISDSRGILFKFDSLDKVQDVQEASKMLLKSRKEVEKKGMGKYQKSMNSFLK